MLCEHLTPSEFDLQSCRNNPSLELSLSYQVITRSSVPDRYSFAESTHDSTSYNDILHSFNDLSCFGVASVVNDKQYSVQVSKSRTGCSVGECYGCLEACREEIKIEGLQLKA